MRANRSGHPSPGTAGLQQAFGRARGAEFDCSGACAEPVGPPFARKRPPTGLRSAPAKESTVGGRLRANRGRPPFARKRPPTGLGSAGDDSTVGGRLRANRSAAPSPASGLQQAFARAPAPEPSTVGGRLRANRSGHPFARKPASNRPRTRAQDRTNRRFGCWRALARTGRATLRPQAASNRPSIGAGAGIDCLGACARTGRATLRPSGLLRPSSGAGNEPATGGGRLRANRPCRSFAGTAASAGPSSGAVSMQGACSRTAGHRHRPAGVGSDLDGSADRLNGGRLSRTSADPPAPLRRSASSRNLRARVRRCVACREGQRARTVGPRVRRRKLPPTDLGKRSHGSECHWTGPEKLCFADQVHIAPDRARRLIRPWPQAASTGLRSGVPAALIRGLLRGSIAREPAGHPSPASRPPTGLRSGATRYRPVGGRACDANRGPPFARKRPPTEIEARRRHQPESTVGRELACERRATLRPQAKASRTFDRRRDGFGCGRADSSRTDAGHPSPASGLQQPSIRRRRASLLEGACSRTGPAGWVGTCLQGDGRTGSPIHRMASAATGWADCGRADFRRTGRATLRPRAASNRHSILRYVETDCWRELAREPVGPPFARHKPASHRPSLWHQRWNRLWEGGFPREPAGPPFARKRPPTGIRSWRRRRLSRLLEGACARTDSATLRPQAASNRPSIEHYRYLRLWEGGFPREPVGPPFARKRPPTGIRSCATSRPTVGGSLLANRSGHPSPALRHVERLAHPGQVVLVGGYDLSRRVGKLDHRLAVAFDHLDDDVDRLGAGVVGQVGADAERDVDPVAKPCQISAARGMSSESEKIRLRVFGSTRLLA